ncbi:MAG: N-acetylmuramoyl-L-alanine amidase [Opitutales bacterium]
MHRTPLIAILLLIPASIFAQASHGEWPDSFPIASHTLEARLDQFYSPLDDWREWIFIDHENQRVKMDLEGPWISLKEASNQTVLSLKKDSIPHITLDPGHIGGEWGPIEGRSFKVGDGPVFQEGDTVLSIAKRVQELLENYPIRVSLARDSSDPIDPKRPSDYIEIAEQWAESRWPDLAKDDPERVKRVESYGNRLFYRSDEIRARAEKINNELKPDLVVCLHINASGWEDPENPSLTDEHNLHILVHGNYTPGELSGVEARVELAHKIANGTFESERKAAEVFLSAFQDATELPPYIYGGNNALKLDEEGYLWARNLAANRLYRSPVVFLEPYVANSVEGYERIQAGNYAGKKMIAGKMRLSLEEEYAQATVAALIELYSLEPIH